MDDSFMSFVYFRCRHFLRHRVGGGGYLPPWFVLEAGVHCLFLWARSAIQDVRDLGIVDADVEHTVGL